jgi:hypothetical protein
LRTAFVVLAVFAVWLGVIVNRAREQREAVRAIEALGGRVIYDWQQSSMFDASPDGPAWLRQVIGDDYFQTVVGVYILGSDADAARAIPYLQQLPDLELIAFPWNAYSQATQDQLKAALPNCRLLGAGP